jgi:hypothetical protein
MKRQNFRIKTLILFAMMLAIVMLAANFPLNAQKIDRVAETPNAGGVIESGYASILIGLLHTEYAKISVVNQGDKDIPVKFVLVDDKGKVLIFCNGVVQTGKSVSATFQHPGGANRLEFYAQIRTESDKDLKNLIPSLQIIDTETDKTDIALGGSDFFSFRPIFNPPLIELGAIQ